jgi:5-methylcytosine-specific restriction endonuclease McrA
MRNQFDTFISHLKLSEVKLTLLKKLWNSGSEFPRDWVKSSELLTLTNQKYFDRRLRELRDSGGLDLETKHINGEHCWRLNSDKISQIINRTYLTAAQKKELFDRASNSCAICGKFSLAGVRGLQADHKVPLSRGGSEALNNWQPICNECNVAKRRICQNCTLNCEECSWAYPDLESKKIVLKIPKDLVEKSNFSKFTEKQWEDYFISLARKDLG